MLVKPLYKTALLIGGGAFGSSMACVLANQFSRVIIKVRSIDVYESLLRGENLTYLPGMSLPANIIPALSWDEVDSLTDGKVELVVSGLPVSAISSFSIENFHMMNRYLEQGVPFVSLSKGIDPETLKFPDDLYFDMFQRFQDQFCFLSGPSFAREIVEKQITLVSLAGRSRKIMQEVSQMLSTHYFMVFPTYDVKGVLLGGALKNVLAIAGGIIEGLGFNHNTQAALVTMGIMDMLSFGTVFNARPETFYGLSGMGDLILSTTGDLSRNKWLGVEVAKAALSNNKRSALEIIHDKRTVVEGYYTTEAAYFLAKRYEIKCPIFHGVYRVLYRGENPRTVIDDLMSRRT